MDKIKNGFYKEDLIAVNIGKSIHFAGQVKIIFTREYY